MGGFKKRANRQTVDNVKSSIPNLTRGNSPRVIFLRADLGRICRLEKSGRDGNIRRFTVTTSDKVLDILSHVAESKEIATNLDMALYDLQILDSMKTVELIVAFSEQFGIDISPAEFERERWATPRLIISDITDRVGS